MIEERRERESMMEETREVQAFHTRPVPEAHPMRPYPFPPGVIRALWLGILIGALVGLLVGILLQRQILVIPSTEGMYSLLPGVLITLWVLAGVALGIVVGGVGGILAAPRPRAAPVDAGDELIVESE
jgi:hypothetical protein